MLFLALWPWGVRSLPAEKWLCLVRLALGPPGGAAIEEALGDRRERGLVSISRIS